MKNILFTLVLWLFTFTTSAQQSWEVVGEGAFLQHSSFALSINNGGVLTTDNNGIPHIVFIDTQYNGGYSKAGILKKFENNNWEYVGGGVFDEDLGLDMVVYLSSSLVFDSNNTPYLVYRNYNGKVKVKTVANGVWQNVGTADISSESSGTCALAINHNDMPYVLYREASDSGKATVKKFENDSWQIVGEAGFSIGGVVRAAMVIDADNIAYVMYSDYGNENNNIYIKKFENGNWSTVGSDEGIEETTHSFQNTLFIGSNNTLYIAYGIRINDNPNVYKVVFRKYIDNQWQLISELVFEGTLIFNASFELFNDIPYVAFSDEENNYKATVKKFENDSWHTVGEAGFSEDAVYDIKITTDDNGVCYVSYKDSATQLYSINVMKYDNTMNIDEHTTNNILLYPNPANDVVIIDNIPENSTIKVFDITGKLVYDLQTADKQVAIDTTSLVSGIYLVQITNNHQKTIKKLIIQ